MNEFLGGGDVHTAAVCAVKNAVASSAVVPSKASALIRVQSNGSVSASREKKSMPMASSYGYCSWVRELLEDRDGNTAGDAVEDSKKPVAGAAAHNKFKAIAFMVLWPPILSFPS